MFGLGSAEILIVCILAIILIGPEKLPGVAKTLGRWTKKAKETIDDLRSDLDRD